MKRILALVLGFLFISGAALAENKNGSQCNSCNAGVGGAKFVVVKGNGKTETYGCPKCAFTTEDMKKIRSAEATDFLTRKPIDAAKAFYLVETEVGACCPPFWLSFSTRESADKFAKGFGGDVLSYPEAVEYFTEKGASDKDPDHFRYRHPYHDQDHIHDWDK